MFISKSCLLLFSEVQVNFIENCVYFFLIGKSQRSAMKQRLSQIFRLSSLSLTKILLILVFQTRNSEINTQHTHCQQLNLYLVDENLDFRAFNSSKFHKYKTVFAATKHTAGPAGTHSRVKSMPHKIRTRHTLPRASSSKKGVSELIFLTMDLAHPWPSGGYKANFFSTIFGGIHKQCDVLN